MSLSLGQLLGPAAGNRQLQEPRVQVPSYPRWEPVTIRVHGLISSAMDRLRSLPGSVLDAWLYSFFSAQAAQLFQTLQ